MCLNKLRERIMLTWGNKSFLASQIALTGFPMGLFVVMTITVVIFALLAGLIIGLLGAVLFIVACVGFALIILLPTLFLTTAAATFIWLWGLGGYYILKWFNQKEIPGIHTDLKGGVEDGIKGQLGALTGDDGPQGDPNGAPKEGEKGDEKKGMNGSAPDPKKAADVGKVTGKAQNATDGVKGATDGVKGAVPVPGT